MSSVAPRRTQPFGHTAAGWTSLLIGLALWTVVQSLTIWGPLWKRSLLPEVDDSLAYLVRTQVMEECFTQDCPALNDLRKQREIGLSDPKVARAHDFSSFPFPFYHPLFSLLILGVKTILGDITDAYRVLWTLSPLFFGSAFACLLTALWGRAAAGIALGLLAFKIFPDTGLHYLTPSNLAMGLAALVWARLISRRGDAPWTLMVGSLLLVLAHPIGALYAVMGMLFSLLLASDTTRWKVRLTILSVCFLSFLLLAAASLVKQPALVHVFSAVHLVPNIAHFVSACTSNLEGILVGISRLKDSLFGEPALFLSAVTMGFLFTTPERRKTLRIVIAIYALVLVVSLYPTHAMSPPGDIFFRLWIPLVAILFGAEGEALARLGCEAWRTLRESRSWKQGSVKGLLEQTWPVVAFALLAGHFCGVAVTGGEHLVALSEYMRNRQDLSFDSAQVSSLLSQAVPGDRVLYGGAMPMQFYFATGAMRLGALYYHPSHSGTSMEVDWLKRPDLRFAVSYNPLVTHPALDGLEEKDRCISSPDYRFSPLNNPRRHGAILKEGFIPLAGFKWMDIQPSAGALPKHLKVFIRNPGSEQDIEILPLSGDGSPRLQQTVRLSTEGQSTGWIRLDLEGSIPGDSYRLIPPKGSNRLALGGVTFDDSRLHWPWERKAKLTLFAKDPVTGKVTCSFDPATLLPRALAERSVEVIDDSGSSVLLRVGP